MAYITSDTVLIRHRKLLALAKDLKLKPVYVMGHLHALWHAALEQEDSGDLSRWSNEFIAESAAYSGDADRFVTLLYKHKWLDGETHGLKVIHDWLDHVGKYLRECKYRRNPEKYEEIINLHKSLKNMYMTENKRVNDSSQVSHYTQPIQHDIYDTTRHDSKDIPVEPEQAPVSVKQIEPKKLTEVQKFVEDFGQLYKNMSGYEYVADKKDFILATAMIKKHGLETVVEKAKILCLACREGKMWFARDGTADFTIGKLSSCWNHLLPNVAMTDEQRAMVSLNRKQQELEDRDVRIGQTINVAAAQ